MRFFKKQFQILLFLLLGFFVLVPNAMAEDGYTAKEVSRNFGKLHIKPGAGITFEIKYKNIGTETWVNTGAHFTQVATRDPVKRKSSFRHKFWEKYFLPGRLKEKSVAPGEIGTFRFALQAPEAEGTYTEKFIGVAKNLAWIEGLEFDIPITVSAKPKVVEAPKTVQEKQETILAGVVEEVEEIVETPSIPEGVHDWAGNLLIKSKKTIEVEAGKTISLSMGFKNIGKKTWYKKARNFVSFYTVKPKYHKSLFYEKTSWLSPNQVRIDTEVVKPGELGFFNFNVKAPTVPGVYTDRFNLAAEDKAWFKHGEFELTIVVVAPKNDVILTSLDGTNISPNGYNLEALSHEGVTRNIVIEEPQIRVGITRYKNEAQETIKIGSSSNYQVIKSGEVLLDLQSGTISEVFYDPETKEYRLTVEDQVFVHKEPLVFKPTQKESLMELVNHEDRPKWNPRLNYNLYKGSLEVRHHERTERTWVINELGMEEYLNGLIETSNPNPIEYLKAMTIAGRSYALYHYLNNYKHGERGFHVDAFYDQVYKGYVAQSYLSRLGDAGYFTKGIVVTYEGENVITPYFAHSDGRTRSWKDVWGGNNHPYLKSVSDPYNQGRSMFGHGVGLSGRGALKMAQNDGATYQDILNYFYTGIELQQQYE